MMSNAFKDMVVFGTGIMQGDQRVDPQDFFLQEDEEFNEWLHELEGFSSRAERLYEDFLEVKRLSKLRMWLQAAYQAGYNKAIDNEKDT